MSIWLGLGKALVTDECALPVTNEATKRHAVKGPICDITVRRGEARRGEARPIRVYR